jgi:hypothetical protein
MKTSNGFSEKSERQKISWRMATCGAILCAVAFFIGFMVLSDMIENASSAENDENVITSASGVVFVGEYSLSIDGSDGTSGPVLKSGICQMRAFSKLMGAADMSLSTVDIRFRDEHGDSEVLLRSGMLLRKDEDTMEFFGRGHTTPLMFELIDSDSSCDLEDVKITFTDPPITNSLMKSVGTLRSRECKFSISFEMNQINLVKLKRKIINYSLLNNALSLGLIKLFIDQIRILDSNSSYSRISMGCIVIQSIADSLDSMINFFKILI